MPGDSLMDRSRLGFTPVGRNATVEELMLGCAQRSALALEKLVAANSTAATAQQIERLTRDLTEAKRVAREAQAEEFRLMKVNNKLREKVKTLRSAAINAGSRVGKSDS